MIQTLCNALPCLRTVNKEERGSNFDSALLTKPCTSKNINSQRQVPQLNHPTPFSHKQNLNATTDKVAIPEHREALLPTSPPYFQNHSLAPPQCLNVNIIIILLIFTINSDQQRQR